ncbi:unnamed protein product [Calypogeia fissa]
MLLAPIMHIMLDLLRFVALALDVGVDEDVIQDAIPNLSAPHRVEIVHQDEKEVLWINDSKATNVDAIVVGLRGITGRKAVVLIGGLAKVVQEQNLGFDRTKRSFCLEHQASR